MNSNRSVETPVMAYLKEPISFVKDGKEVVIEKNTLILVDTSRGIALIANDHVDIYPEEYQVLSA